MNKTKRKIFETSMKLFAEKGYDATSIEEITATVGVAKGTLYYHFSSKEEIFNFLIEEGMKLLQNSIEIKTSKFQNYIDKLKAIVLIQIKIVMKYEDLITISDTFGDFLEEEISKIVSTKELEDIDLGIVANYLNDQLDVSCNVELLFDELTEVSNDSLENAIDEAYLKLDNFIENNYKE